MPEVKPQEQGVAGHIPMLRPTTTFRLGWDMACAVFVLYLGLVIPFRFCFDHPVEEDGVFAVSIDYAIEVFFIADLFLNFRTGYVQEDGTEVLDEKLVAKQYLTTWFALDFVSSIPFDWIWNDKELSSLQSAKLVKIGRLLKAFKVLRIAKIVKLANKDSGIADVVDEFMVGSKFYSIFVLLRVLIFTGCVSHILACVCASQNEGFLNSYAEFNEDEVEPCHPTEHDSDDGDNDDEACDPAFPYEIPLRSRYVAALYWAITTITTVGYGDILPGSDVERAFAMFAMLVGGSFYGYVISVIASIVASSDANSREYAQRMENIQGVCFVCLLSCGVACV